MSGPDLDARLSDLVARYVAVWNERDPARRREQIAALWTPDGAALHKRLEARGYDGLEERVRTAHEKWVRDAGYRFVPLERTDGHHGSVRFHWQMVKADGEVVSTGFDFFLLADDGRIRTAYQFNDP